MLDGQSSGPQLVEFPEPTTSAELVQFARDLLEAVQEGRYTALAVVQIHQDGGGGSTTWAWDVGVNACALIGASAVLTKRLIRELDPQEER